MRISDWSSDVCSSDLSEQVCLRPRSAVFISVTPFVSVSLLVPSARLPERLAEPRQVIQRQSDERLVARLVALGRVGELLYEIADLCGSLRPGLRRRRNEKPAELVLTKLQDGLADLELVKIGRAHDCTPVTNAQLVCRLLLEKKKN